MCFTTVVHGHTSFEPFGPGHKDFRPVILGQENFEPTALGHEDLGLVAVGLEPDLILARVDPVDRYTRVVAT